MDPVKEKLNQLKKLASERKAAHLNNKVVNDPHEQEKFVKFVRNKLNNFIGGISKQPSQDHDDPEQRKIRAENQKRNELQYQKSVETIEKEKAESLSLEKYEKLQKEIEVITLPIENRSSQIEYSANSEADSLLAFDDTKKQQKIRSVSIDNGYLNNETNLPSKNISIISSPKQPLKGFTITSNNNNNDTSTTVNNNSNSNNKYISRIKNIYDSKNELKSVSRDHTPFTKYKRNQAPLASQDDATKNSPDELVEQLYGPSRPKSEQESESWISLQSASENSNWESSNLEAASPRPSRNYVQSMLDAFRETQNNNGNTNDLEGLLQQRLLANGDIISESSSNNGFDKLRERFSSREESSSRYEQKMQSPLLISTKDADQANLLNLQPDLLNNRNSYQQSVASVEENIEQLEKLEEQSIEKLKKRNMLNQGNKKYQKSKTINLSEFINNKQTDSNINDIKFDKFDKQRSESQKKDELRYLAENNRIMLTLGKFGEEAPHVSPELIEPLNDTQRDTNFSKSKSPKNFIIEKPTEAELMMGAELNRIRLNNKPDISCRSSAEPSFSEQRSAMADAAPVIKKTKSILKLPSNVPEKSICFDERVDVIPISDSIDQSSTPINYTTRLSSGDSFLKVPKTEYSNTVKQLSMEAVQTLRDSPLRVSPKKSLSSSYNRSFERNRSPAPMREIIIPQVQTKKPEYHEMDVNTHPANFPLIHNHDEDSSKNNRNRFKKKIINRSKSVETPLPYENQQGFDNQIDQTDKYFYKNIPSIVITNETPKLNRPFLQRQDAMNVNKSVTKSLGDNLNRVHEVKPSNNKSTKTSRNRHHRHHHNRNTSRKNHHRRSKYASTSLSSSEISSETENSQFFTNSETSRSSSSDFSPRQSTLNLHSMMKLKNRVGHEEDGYRPFNINRARNSKTEDKQTRHRFNHREKMNYSSDDSVCGIPKPSLNGLCSGSTKQFHKSMEELSYVAKAAGVDHPYNYNEIESTSIHSTLPINPAILKPAPNNQLDQNSYNSNRPAYADLNQTKTKSHSLSTEPAMITNKMNYSSNIPNIENLTSQLNDNQNKQWSQLNSKITYNSKGQPIHPGLRPIGTQAARTTLPSYSQLVNDEKISPSIIKSVKAPTILAQTVNINDTSKKNSHLNLKNQYLPYQINIESNQNGNRYDQKRSLSPTTMENNSEKNVVFKSQVKPLPTYSSYVNKHNTAIKKPTDFEPQKPANTQTVKYPFSSALDSQNNLMTKSTMTSNLVSSNNNKLMFQQNKSKSFDAGQADQMMSISTNELNSSARNYSNLTDQFNKTQGQLDEMPQSAAIQEKLRRFETINDAKPFSSHQSNNQNYKPTMMNTTEKSKESTTSLGRGLIDETSRSENISLNRLLSPQRSSPLETNKENSPFSSKPTANNPTQLHMFQSPSINSSNSTSQYSINNQGLNSNSTLALSSNKTAQIKQQQALFLQNMGYLPNKNGGFTKELIRSSPGRGAPSQSLHTPTYNQYKYSQYISPSTANYNQFNKATSTPPVINSSLAAATAAASAALESQTQTSFYNQTVKTQPVPNNSLQKSKTIKSDYSIANKFSAPVYSNDNYDFMSLQPQGISVTTNNKNASSYNTPEPINKYSDHEKSVDRLHNKYHSLGSTSSSTNQSPSIVSKRAALFEQKLEQHNLSPQFQNSTDYSQNISFNRSANLSPSHKISKLEDTVDMHSSSGGSIGSFKENKRPISLHDSNNNSSKKIGALENSKPRVLQDFDTETSLEPHKMSISEKMKLFQPINSSSTINFQNGSLKTDSSEIKKSTSKRNTNRFQTQPVSLADFEYANDNYVSQANLLKPLNNNQQEQQQQKQSTSPKKQHYTLESNHKTNRPISLNELQFLPESLSTGTSNTSSPSSLTTSTSSSNHEQPLTSPPTLRKSIQSLKLELEKSNKQTDTPLQPVSNQHVLANKQNQLNNVKTNLNLICMNQNLITKSQNQISMNASIEIINRDVLLKKSSHDKIITPETKKIQTLTKKSINPLVSKIQNTNNNLIKSENLKSTSKQSPINLSLPDNEHLEDNLNSNSKTLDNKRFKLKNKTFDFNSQSQNYMSLPVEPSPNINVKQSRDNLSDDENKTVPMTIQERMAALKKNNSMDWKTKQRSPLSNTSAEESSNTTGEQKVSLVKQHQMQLKQQLLMATPKTQTPYQLRTEQKNREILAALDNNDDTKDETNNKSSDDFLEENSAVNVQPKTVNRKSLMFNAELEKALSLNKAPGLKQKIKTESIKDEVIDIKPEIFSTDSEMDSFFKECDPVGTNYRYNDLFSSSCGSPSRTDDNLNDDFDDDFDKVMSNGQRLTQGTRAKPMRKTKSKGNHLKNLQNRAEVTNDYDEKSTGGNSNQPIVTAELLQNRLKKSSVLN